MAAKTQGFSISVGVIDKATAKINEINKSLRTLQAPVQRFQKSLATFGKVTHITQAFDKVKGAISSAFSMLAKFVPLLGTLTAGGIVAGIAAITRTWAEFATQLAVTSSWLGISASKLQTMQNANRLMGGTAAEAAQSFEALDDALQNAAAGRDPQFAAFLNALGINFHKSALEAKSASEILPRAYELIRQAAQKGNSAEVRLLAQKFHLTQAQTRAARRYGAEAITMEEERARKLGVLSDSETDDLDKQRESYTSLQIAVENFAARLAIALGPTLTPIIDSMVKWLSNTDNVREATEKITTTIQTFKEWLEKAWHTINGVVESIGGWKVAFEGLIALKVAGWLSGLIGPLTTLAAFLASNPAVLAFLGLGAGAVAAGHQAAKSASLEAKAGDLGFDAIGYTENGMATGYRNNKSGEILNVEEMKDRVAAEDKRRTESKEPALGSAPEGPAPGNPIINKLRDWIHGGSTPPPLSPAKDPASFYGQQRQQIYDAAIRAGLPNPGVVADVGAAQASLETGGGKHTPGGHNVFGIKGSGSAGSTSAETTEYINGRATRMQQSFAAYKTDADAADAYVNTLKNNKRYAGVINAKTTEEAVAAQAHSGYATDPNYGPKLAGIIRSGMGGAPVGLQTQTASTVDGKISVDVNHNNAPPGATVTASTAGANLAPPRVMQPMMSI